MDIKTGPNFEQRQRGSSIEEILMKITKTQEFLLKRLKRLDESVSPDIELSSFVNINKLLLRDTKLLFTAKRKKKKEKK